MAADSPNAWKPMTLALTVGVAVLAGCSSLLPETVRPWNFAAIGAVGLFAAARLRPLQALLVLALAIAVKDLCMIVKWDFPPDPLTWLAYLGYAAIGYGLLRHTESPLRVGAGAVAGSLAFFLVSNFGSWIMQAQPYAYSLAGLVDCYEAGIPFHRSTLISDVLCSVSLFVAHMALSRAWFPAERPTLAPIPIQAEETW